MGKIVRRRTNDGEPMFPDVHLLGGLIAGLEWEGGTVRPPEKQSDKAFFWMRVVVTFIEDKYDPYALT
jgi:hypothetical protein